MKAFNMALAFVLLASATSFAEQRPWKTVESVRGTATYGADNTGRKFCTHPEGRFAHSYNGSSEFVVDKETGKTANYYNDVMLTKPGMIILVNADRVPNMPNYIARVEGSTIYFNKLNEMGKGILDRGFSFHTDANDRTQKYTVICEKN